MISRLLILYGICIFVVDIGMFWNGRTLSCITAASAVALPKGLGYRRNTRRTDGDACSKPLRPCEALIPIILFWIIYIIPPHGSVQKKLSKGPLDKGGTIVIFLYKGIRHNWGTLPEVLGSQYSRNEVSSGCRSPGKARGTREQTQASNL